MEFNLPWNTWLNVFSSSGLLCESGYHFLWSGVRVCVGSEEALGEAENCRLNLDQFIN